MKSILALLFFLPFGLWAQNSFNSQAPAEGIHFEEGESWSQTLAKAKRENKFVFVDCFTTWCVPCKKMERDVYSLKKVADFFNDKFISVKLQMDTTQKDNDFVKQQYANASKIQKEYSVNSFPTYLFFNGDGKLLFRATGMQSAEVFIATASDAIDPKKSYYSFLEDYKNGKRDYEKIGLMAKTAISLNDTVSAPILAKDYINHLKKSEWFTKDNIEFLRDFTKTTKDLGFSIFLNYADTVNKVIEDEDFAQHFVQSTIYNDYIADKLAKAAENKSAPKWDNMKTLLQKKFGNYYAERVIESAKPTWYRKQKNVSEYTKSLVLYFDKYEFPKMPLLKTPEGSLKDLVLNNYAWEMFKYSNNKEELTKALKWSSRAIMLNPIANWMDTYANLCYKLGETGLAIKWEEIASKLNPKDGDIQQNLDKMKKGIATWPQ